MLLQVKQLSKRFGRIHALSDVSFHVNAGEILGLIGPNGAGKSTLFECMAGTLPYDSGKVLAEGRLFYIPDGICPWPAQPVSWVARFYASAFCRAVNRCATNDRAASFRRIAPAAVGRPIQRSAEARAARHRLADAATGAAHRRTLRWPGPAAGARHGGRLARARGAMGARSSSPSTRSADAERFCDRFVLLSGGRVCGEGTVPELAAAARAMPAPSRSGRGLPCAHLGRLSSGCWTKECRELLVSRAWWVLLLGMGPLVGVSFISAVRTYAEVSGLNGTAAGVGEALVAPGRRLGAHLQRLGTGCRFPASVRRHSRWSPAIARAAH